MKPRLATSAAAVLLLAILTLGAAPACSTETGASAQGTGDPCLPSQERDVTFSGFEEREVNIEIAAPACATGVCLVNHFRGRVSCPYGQAADGAPPPGASPCVAPGKNAQVTGDTSNPARGARVSPQCLDRSADKTVYCSCRCANDQGRTDDGSSYCACPTGFECSPLVTSIGASTRDIAGSYCIKRGTAYDKNTACSMGDCDPTRMSCG